MTVYFRVVARWVNFELNKEIKVDRRPTEAAKISFAAVNHFTKHRQELENFYAHDPDEIPNQRADRSPRHLG